MRALDRWIPRLLIATAVLHFAFAFAQPNDWAGIVGDGFFRANVDPDAASYDLRESSIWFMVGGVAILAIGTLTRSAVRATGRVPVQVGWYLLAIGVPLCAIYFPVAGSWTLVVIGFLTLLANRRPAASADARQPDRQDRADVAG